MKFEMEPATPRVKQARPTNKHQDRALRGLSKNYSYYVVIDIILYIAKEMTYNLLIFIVFNTR